MFARLGAWTRPQILLISAICIPLAGWFGWQGEYTKAALLVMLPILGLVETWGAANPTRRTRGYRAVLGLIVLVFALLLWMRWTNP